MGRRKDSKRVLAIKFINDDDGSTENYHIGNYGAIYIETNYPQSNNNSSNETQSNQESFNAIDTYDFFQNHSFEHRETEEMTIPTFDEIKKHHQEGATGTQTY